MAFILIYSVAFLSLLRNSVSRSSINLVPVIRRYIIGQITNCYQVHVGQNGGLLYPDQLPIEYLVLAARGPASQILHLIYHHCGL